MMRWLEEFELKHVEFVRCISSFRAMATAWGSIADGETRGGYAAFARHQSHIFCNLHDDAVRLFEKNAEPGLRAAKDDLVEGIRKLRKRELGWLWKLVGLDLAMEAGAYVDDGSVGKLAENQGASGVDGSIIQGD
jgi:hypothetical protein